MQPAFSVVTQGVADDVRRRRSSATPPAGVRSLSAPLTVLCFRCARSEVVGPRLSPAGWAARARPRARARSCRWKAGVRLGLGPRRPRRCSPAPTPSLPCAACRPVTRRPHTRQQVRGRNFVFVMVMKKASTCNFLKVPSLQESIKNHGHINKLSLFLEFGHYIGQLNLPLWAIWSRPSRYLL